MSRTPKIWFRQGLQLKDSGQFDFKSFLHRTTLINTAQDKESGPNLKPLEHIPTLEGDRRILKDCIQLNLITIKLIIMPTCNQKEV